MNTSVIFAEGHSPESYRTLYHTSVTQTHIHTWSRILTHTHTHTHTHRQKIQLLLDGGIESPLTGSHPRPHLNLTSDLLTYDICSEPITVNN